MTFWKALRVFAALLISTCLVGCLLGPPEDAEPQGEDEASQYETEATPLRVDRPSAINATQVERLPDDEGQIGHGTPDPLDPFYSPTPQAHGGPAWKE